MASNHGINNPEEEALDAGLTRTELDTTLSHFMTEMQDQMEVQLRLMSDNLMQAIGAGGQRNVTAQVPAAGLVSTPVIPVTPVVAAHTPHRRRLDSSSLEKMSGEITVPNLVAWRNRWNDFSQLNQLDSYPLGEQQAALRMAMDTSMQQVLEIALGITAGGTLTPVETLDRIAAHIRSKRNVALDRVAFEECNQALTETFDEFYI